MAAKNVLIFIHGIGVHQAGWSSDEEKGPQNALERAAEYYGERFPAGGSTTNPLSNSLNYVEIRYDDIFERVRTTWNTLAEDLRKSGFPGATPTEIGKVSQALADLTQADEWFATHALDAVMYGFPLIRQVVRHSLASQLANAIARHKSEGSPDPRFSILAHSLGTAVTHDALQLLGTTAWMKHPGAVPEGIDDGTLVHLRQRYGDNPFSPGHFKWQAVFMVANVARIFCEPRPDSQRSIVRPILSRGAAENAVRFYYNFGHAMDPVAAVARFSGVEAWPRAAAEGYVEDHMSLRHFHDKNIHGLAHYIKHPRVHARILLRTVPGRFREEHLGLADARVGPGGDFSNFGFDIADDDIRDGLQEGLSQVLDDMAKVRKLTERFQTALHQFGPLV